MSNKCHSGDSWAEASAQAQGRNPVLKQGRLWRPHYTWILLGALLVLAFANIHISLTHTPQFAEIQSLIDFDYRRPFILRILPFVILHTAQITTHWSLGNLLFAFETLSLAALAIVLYSLLKQWLPKPTAYIATFVFLALLPYAYLLHYVVNLYFPYDTPALAFLGLGILCIWQQRWGWLYFVMFIATLNRESSVLLIPLLWAVRPPQWRWQSLLVPAVILFWIFILTRAAVSTIFIDAPGFDFWFFYNGELRSYRNLLWISEPRHFLMLISNLMFLPIIAWTLRAYLPETLKRLNYVALLYFFGLLFVGNFYEPRIFGEVVMLLYLPTVIALYRWRAQE